ncbi:basic secretory protein-like protein [Prevotella sp. 10(H)]|uniref:basic secretory protein-like protein n=1 Tax=Prevotella sp. 10(H) TaxID=1158294 RepID=UPI0004A6E4DE|nr:basic secretory protein-like protein [Prevotella sp. 10(H)]
MKKLILSIITLTFLACQGQSVVVNPHELTDNDLTTTYTGTKDLNQIVFDTDFSAPVLSYKIYSSGELPAYDPSQWTLKGSNDGKEWVTVDERSNQTFFSRFQEILCVVQNPQTFKTYKLEASTLSKDTLKIGEVVLSDKNLLAGWEDFNYPNIQFESLSPDTEGSKVYHELVQNPDEYIKFHARKVAEILYYTDKDSINDVRNIKYTLEDKPGVSAKGGNTPNIHIFYSTQHIEKSAKESLFKLDFETRGVLYHELTHGYQYEPKGIGNYGNNKTFWACIEGIADAVRAEAGYFDMSTRKPGGNWMDGYRTTGFFIQWLTTKDPDAIRKFHATVEKMDVWSFDGAIKLVFGPEASIEGMWEEYQTFLKNQ